MNEQADKLERLCGIFAAVSLALDEKAARAAELPDSWAQQVRQISATRRRLAAMAWELVEQTAWQRTIESEASTLTEAEDRLVENLRALPEAIDQQLGDIEEATRFQASASLQRANRLADAAADCRRRLAVALSALQRIERSLRN